MGRRPAVGKLLYAVVLVLIAAAAVRAVWVAVSRRTEFVPVALAVAVVAYPFLYAAAPGTAYWNDGRYGIYLPAFVVLLFATALLTWRVETPPAVPAKDAAPVRPGALVVGAIGVFAALCLTVAGAGRPGSRRLLHQLARRRCADAARPERHAGAPHHRGLRRLLDRLRPRLPERGKPHGQPLAARREPFDGDLLRGGVDQESGLALLRRRTRRRRRRPCSTIPSPGPGPYTEQTFEAYLTKLGIPYKVVRLGVLDAVIPQRPLPPL